jgi:hypothetical protein
MRGHFLTVSNAVIAEPQQTDRTERLQRMPYLIPTALVALTAIAELLILGGSGFLTARRAEPVLRFFDPRRPPTMDEAWTGCVMDYALASTENNDVIFLGDSICRSGIEPNEFEQRTRLRGYNLGVLFGGLGPEVMPSVARTYLLRHPTPGLVVFCMSPVCFEKEVDAAFVQLHERFLGCFVFEAPNLQTLAGIRSYAQSILFLSRQGTVLGWYRWRDGRQHDVRDDFLDEKRTQTYRSLEKQTRTARGFYSMVGSGRKGFLDRTRRVVRIDPAWDRGVRRLASICQQAHVPLLIRLGPISSGASRDLNFSAVEQWLSELGASCPQLIIERDNRILRYPPEFCSDGMHCNFRGAVKFTSRVANEVLHALGPTATDGGGANMSGSR